MPMRTRDAGSKRPTPQGRANALLVAALIALAMSVAACGGSPSTGVARLGSTTTSSPSSSAQTASTDALEFVQCMRTHGVSNLPDSAVSASDGHLAIAMPAGVKREPAFASASMACGKYLRSGLPVKHVNVQEELNFANCMRSHGITDFPDPKPGGGFNIVFNTTSPQFEAAASACESTGIHWDSAP